MKNGNFDEIFSPVEAPLICFRKRPRHTLRPPPRTRIHGSEPCALRRVPSVEHIAKMLHTPLSKCRPLDRIDSTTPLHELVLFTRLLEIDHELCELELAFSPNFRKDMNVSPSAHVVHWELRRRYLRKVDLRRLPHSLLA